MVFYFLIFIVFIAELIIAITAFRYLYKVCRNLQDMNEVLGDIKPRIKDVVQIIRKLSEK